MTFWQDARPFPSRPPAPSGRRARDRARTRRRAGTLATVAVVVGVAVVLGLEPSSGARRVPEPARAAPARWEPVPARWGRALADDPRELVVDRSDAVVIGSRSVTALRLTDGAPRWQATLDRPEPWAALAPGVVVVSTTGGFVALDRATGAARWSAPTEEGGGPVALVAPPGLPAVAILTTRAGGLVGVDAGSGVARWSLRLAGAVRGTPAVDDATGSVAIVERGAEARLRVLDAVTGSPRWDRAIEWAASTPAIGEGTVVVGAGDGRYRATVSAWGLADGAPRWTAKVPASFQPGLRPTVAGGDVYALDQLDHVTRVDGRTGIPRWTRALRGAALVGAPVVIGDVVLVVDATRSVVTVDRATGRVLARRAAAGVPVRIAPSGRLVVLAQRLVARDQIAAYPAAAVGGIESGSARSRK